MEIGALVADRSPNVGTQAKKPQLAPLFHHHGLRGLKVHNHRLPSTTCPKSARQQRQVSSGDRPPKGLIVTINNFSEPDPREDILQQLALLEKGERDDHAAALALQRGDPLPPPTKAQLEMRKLSFAELFGKFMVVDKPKIAAEITRPEPGPSGLYVRRLCIWRKRAEPNRVECVVCRDMVECMICLNGPCGHFICRQCVIAMAEVAGNNEELFPLQCCQQPLSTDVVLSYLPGPLRMSFSSACAEAATPPDCRIYCPNKRCSTFVGRRPSSNPTIVSCPECSTNICSQCKTKAHPNESCDYNESRQVRALAKEKGWKTCPKCKMVVEREAGCPHMVCRCRQAFCYGCGEKWGACKCHSRRTW